MKRVSFLIPDDRVSLFKSLLGSDVIDFSVEDPMSSAQSHENLKKTRAPSSTKAPSLKAIYEAGRSGEPFDVPKLARALTKKRLSPGTVYAVIRNGIKWGIIRPVEENSRFFVLTELGMNRARRGFYLHPNLNGSGTSEIASKF
jgi:hypothetical protein